MKRTENSSPPLARRGVAGAIAAALAAVFGMLFAVSVPQTSAGFSGSGSVSSTWSSTLNPPSTAVGLGLGSAGNVYATAISNGILYIGGDFVTINGTTRNRLAAFNLTDGSLMSWNPNINNIVRALTVDNGVVYVGGDFTQVNGATSRNYAAAFPTADVGSTALAWDPNCGASVLAIAVDPTSKVVYLGGSFVTVNGGVTARKYAAAFPGSPATATASTWNPNLNAAVRAITLSGTNVILGGSFTTASLSNTTRNYAASFRASNGNLNSWNPNINAAVYALLTASDTGRIYLAGTFTTVGGVSRSRLASVDPTSAALTTWNPSAANNVYALVYDATNQIVYAGGTFSGSIGSQSRNRVAAMSSTTGIGLGWAPEADNTVWALSFDAANSRVAIGGGFAFIGKRESLGITVVSAAVFSAVATVGGLSLDTGATGSIRAMARLGDIVYLGGDFTWISGQYRQHLAAIDLSTGSLTSWAPRVDGLVSALAVNPSTGIVYAAGAFNYSDASIRNRLAAFDAAGALQDWAPSSDNSVLALAGDWSSGVIYAGGLFANIGASARAKLTAITLDTGEATTFNGLIASGQVNALALDTTNRRLYAGGSWTTTVQTVTRPYAAAFDLNGASPTSNLLAWAPAPNAAVNALALSTDRSVVYLGGAFTTLSSGAASRVYLGAVAFDTGTPTSWAPTLNQVVNAIAIDPTRGTVLITGAFTSINGSTTNQRLAALDPASGTPTAWKATVSNTGYAVVMGRTDSEVVAGGSFTTVTPVSTAITRVAIAVLTGDTISVPTLTALSLTLTNAAGTVTASVISGSTLYIGGTFTYVGGAARNRLAAIDLTTNTLLPWNPNAGSTVSALAYDATNDVVYAGGAFTTMGGVSRAYLAAIPGAPGTANPAPLSWDAKLVTSGVNAIAMSADTLYITGSFTAVNTSTARKFAAALPLHPATPTATAWNPTLGAAGSAIAVDTTNGVVYVGGSFTTVNTTTTRNRLAAFPTTGAGTATSWDPDVNNVVSAIAVDPVGGFVYAGGTFTTANTTVGSVTRNRAAAFPLSGLTATATSWNPNASSTVSALFIDADNQLIYLGGSFTTVNSLSRTRAAAVVMDDVGSVLPWSPSPSSTVSTFALNATNGNVVMGGAFTKISYLERGGLGDTSGALATDPPTYQVTDNVITGSTSAIVNASIVVGDRLYVAGDFVAVGTQVRRRVAVFDLGTLALRTDFANTGIASAVSALAVSPDRSRVYVGGAFTQAATVNSNLVTASRLVSYSIGATTSMDSWAPAPNSTVSALALASDATLYAGGSFTTIGGLTRKYIAALSTTAISGSPATWAPDASASVLALALDETRGRIYAGGTFTTIGAVTRNRLAALTLASTTMSAVSTWIPDPSSTVRSIAVAPSDGTVYAVGDFVTVSATTTPVTRLRAAAWRADGTLTSFDPNLTGTYTYAVAVEPGTSEVYIGGDFTAAAGNATITRLGRFDMTTGSAKTWSSGLSATVYTAAISVPYKRVFAGGNSLTAGAVSVSGGAVY